MVPFPNVLVYILPGEKVEGPGIHQGAGEGAAVGGGTTRWQHQVPLTPQDLTPSAVHPGAGQALRIQVGSSNINRQSSALSPLS